MIASLLIPLFKKITFKMTIQICTYCKKRFIPTTKLQEITSTCRACQKRITNCEPLFEREGVRI